MAAQPLVIGAAEAARLLPMEACIPLMTRALAAFSAGEALAPVRLVMTTADGAGDLALMPGHLGTDAVGFKAVTVFPAARDAGQPSHQATVFLIDPGTGRLQAIVDGTSLTRIRTAAVSAVATSHLARGDASVLTILGTGAQAEAHLASIPLVRELAEIRVWGRRTEVAARLAERADGLAPSVRAVASVETAVRGADIIVTATTAVTPLVERSWLADGCHINAVGSCVPTAREIDTATVGAARIFVEDRAAAAVEAGDLSLAAADGCEVRIAGELGDVISGRIVGRQTDRDVTLFESLGVGVEDVAAANHVLQQALATDGGTRLSLA